VNKLIKPIFAFIKVIEKKVIGKKPWENYIHVDNFYIIKKTYTKNEDIQYTTFDLKNW